MLLVTFEGAELVVQKLLMQGVGETQRTLSSGFEHTMLLSQIEAWLQRI